jgi:hypothetical protein
MKRNGIARRNASIVGWVAVLLSAACLPVSSALAVEGSCANEARRTEQSSTQLPNCRAYEQVTPVAKDSGEPKAVEVGLHERPPFEPIAGARAAVDGERMAWVSEYALPGLVGPSTTGVDYLSTRGSEGWSSEATVPPQSPQNGLLCPLLDGIVGWSSDLTDGILHDVLNGGDTQEQGRGEFQGQGFGCGHPEPALKEVDGTEIKEPQGFQNLFVRDSETRSYRLVNVTPNTAPKPTPRKGVEFQHYFPPNFLAGSAELNHVVFEDELPLAEEAEHLTEQGRALTELEEACKEEPKSRACWEGHDDLYVWSEVQQPAVRLVTLRPDGKPVEGALAGSTRNAQTEEPANRFVPSNIAGYRHAVSADGSRIFFEAEGNLYVRENGGQPQSALASGSTAVNGQQCAEPEKACTVELDASQGGSGTGGGKWLASSVDGARAFFIDESELTSTSTATAGKPDLYEYDSEAEEGRHLTDLTVDTAEPADVLGVSGASDDGSDVYFVADGVLPGSGENSQKATAQPGQPNLYVSREGATAFIATLSGEDLCDWTSNTGCNLAEPNIPGSTGLTARVSGNGQYLAFNSVSRLTGYDDVGPVCAPLFESGGFTGKYVSGSCEEIFLYEAGGSHLACVSCNPEPNVAPSAQGAAIDWPARPNTDAEITDDYPQRNVSETGQVFFETSEPLLPQQDTNGLRDVYEYERGALHLISSGTSSAPSYFLDATPSGSDVFFTTAQKLLPRDTESTYNIYDARVDGGFLEPPSPAPPCESECRGSAGTSPVFSAPSSTTFTGSDNIPKAKTSTKPKPRTAKQKREAKLRRELRGCTKRYPHNEHKRAQCERLARRSFSQKRAKASRRDRKRAGR